MSIHSQTLLFSLYVQMEALIWLFWEQREIF